MAEAYAKDNWSSEAYQNSASFVPKLATKVLQWLDVQPDDRILDIGCGDGILNLQIAQTLSQGTGIIHGIDSSSAMITTAKKAVMDDPILSKKSICTFEVLDAAAQLPTSPPPARPYTKIFSNAAMHWILAPESTRESFFRCLHPLLVPSGIFVFEMGGMGNVAEMHTALLSATSRRVGISRAREIDPWFFPDESWMTDMLEVKVGGWKVERIEREFRPTRADEGGVEGWVRLFAKKWLDVVGEEKGDGEREACVKEVCELLKTVCSSPGGGDWFGYVRLRAVVRRI